MPVSQLGDRRAPKGSSWIRATVHLASGECAQLEDYAWFLPPGATNAHQVYKFDLAGHTLLLPALTVAQAVFRPFRKFATSLYSPTGLDTVCFPANAECSKVDWTVSCPVDDLFGSHMMAFGWAWAFPSGRALWDSAYEYARMGLLGADLPRACVDIAACVSEESGRLFAVEASVIALEPEEDPFDFWQSARRARIFHRLPRTLFPRGATVLDLR